MIYNNKFFKTREDAKAFQKQNGGVLIQMPKRDCERMRSFRAEMAVAWDARRERINPFETPYVVAWNEPD